MTVSAMTNRIDGLEVSFPREGTGCEVGGVAVVTHARNLDGAKAYLNQLELVDYDDPAAGAARSDVQKFDAEISAPLSK